MDRNPGMSTILFIIVSSLSARRAWIEITQFVPITTSDVSLSARRAWIEIYLVRDAKNGGGVALRKESVDRNDVIRPAIDVFLASLSARRAWIEIDIPPNLGADRARRSPQGERG